MKKTFVIIAVLLTFSKVNLAQVSIQPILPTVGIVQKSQLWNLLAVNNTSLNYECKLSLVLRDRITGVELLTAASGVFTLSQGAKQLNANVIAPIQYNNLQTGIDNKLQGLLPVGSYMACYTLTGVVQKELNLAEECVPFDIEPLSPPMLITPSDSSILEVGPAQFSWIPPTPDGMFNGLYYDVIITPINDGQKAAEAIQENLPFYNEGNHLFTSLNYPSSMPSFEKDKWYAWQVVAKDNQNYAGKSEVWVFKIGGESKNKTEVTSYAEVKPFYTGKKYYFKDTINFSFTNPYAANKLEYLIKEVANKNKITDLPKINMQGGLNQIAIDIRKLKHIKYNQEYVLEIYKLGNMVHYINFVIEK